MKYELTKEILAGTFFLAGIIIIVLSVLSLGSKTGIAEPKYFLDVVFSDVGGLRTGAPVRVAGVDVGTVVEIGFVDIPSFGDSRVRVTLGILKKYKEEVDRCRVFSIKTEGLLGDKLIDIQLPSLDGSHQLVVTDGYIVGQDPLDITNLADDFSETTRYFIFLTKKMTSLVENLQLTVRTSKRVMDRIEEKLIEGGLFNVLLGKEKHQ
ncbi:MlaD family protein [Candidatus Omnitrophota bacterium]